MKVHDGESVPIERLRDEKSRRQFTGGSCRALKVVFAGARLKMPFDRILHLIEEKPKSGRAPRERFLEQI